MNKNLKIMIACDGSDHSETAIDDLQFAGLPREGTALIVSVEDSMPPSTLSEFDLVSKSITSRRILSTATLLKERASETLENLSTSIAQAAENVRLYLPEWEIETKVLRGAPSNVLLKEAEFWEPDLVIAGSRKRTAFGRFFLGSVSTELANKLDCTIRIGRGATIEKINIHPRIMAEITGSPETETVIRHIGNRVWSDETEIRLLMVEDKFQSKENSKVLSKQQLRLEWAIEQLEDIGMKISVEFIKGDPKSVFLEAAERWKANSIFVPANGFSDSAPNGLSENASNLANSANCTVEIVR